MAGTKEIKRRIKSVKNTKKITKKVNSKKKFSTAVSPRFPPGEAFLIVGIKGLHRSPMISG